ncbi:hypothetical protein Q428_11110 [Fervidicella metallireducens AeB]|uniref:DUF5667 domain-containing protein n=1 Tax=Fervidicella metallireducens AeB TaxID=1403537 RepID=A0A017RVB5_9CLOT|nr:DUF5667 domain-containing protein [Fervidicella metallireducens]EYE87855.1 hypothetical protein Q428_11110 [Fervidicella metallireducens AeB]
MKRIALLLAAIFFTANINIKVFAEETSTLKDQAGITPDSILYPIDKALDDLKISISTTEEKKVEAITDVAQERLGESQVLIEKGKEDIANTSIDEYKQKINEAVEVIENVNNTTNDEKAEKDIDKIGSIVLSKQEKAIEVLKEIQNKVGEESKESITKVIEMQVAKKEAVKNMVQKRHELNISRQAMQQAKIELEKAIKTGNDDLINKARESLLAKEELFNGAKDELKKSQEAKKNINNINKELKKEAVKDIKEEAKKKTITKEEKKRAIQAINVVSKTKNEKKEHKVKEIRKTKLKGKAEKLYNDTEEKMNETYNN